MATKSVTRKSKTITNKEDIDYIVSLSREQCQQKSIIMELFADFGDGPRFNTYDIITIPKGSYGEKKKNKNNIVTTVGCYIFNKGLIEEFSDIFCYINEAVDKDGYEYINKIVSYQVLEDKVTVEQLKQFIMQPQIYMSCTSAIAPSHTMKLLLLSEEVEAQKKKLLKDPKYKLIADGKGHEDLKLVEDFESELLNFAKDALKDDMSVDMFASGARSSWGNNFKNMYVGNFTIQQTDRSYSVVLSSYMSGMKKEDFAKVNDNGVVGGYSKAGVVRSAYTVMCAF